MATATMTTRSPLPPFTDESAVQKVRLAEDSWNTRDPGKVALAYAIDSRWSAYRAKRGPPPSCWISKDEFGGRTRVKGAVTRPSDWLKGYLPKKKVSRQARAI